MAFGGAVLFWPGVLFFLRVDDHTLGAQAVQRAFYPAECSILFLDPENAAKHPVKRMKGVLVTNSVNR